MLVGNNYIVEIPKNASSTIREYNSLDTNRMWTDCADKVKNYYVILRDPYIRWLSATLEWTTEHQDFIQTWGTFRWDPEYHERKVRHDLIPFLSRVESGHHTEPQVKFIPKPTPSQNIFYYALEDKTKNLSALCKTLNLFPNGIPQANAAAI